VIASGWKIVLDILRGLEKSGLKDVTAHAQLRKDDGLRSRYLALCDVVNVLVDLRQMQFSVLATTTRTMPPLSCCTLLILSQLIILITLKLLRVRKKGSLELFSIGVVSRMPANLSWTL